MRCVITGVAGFLGSHLAEALLQRGHEVCGIDALLEVYPRSIKLNNLKLAREYRSFQFVEADLLLTDLRSLLDGADWVFHFAAQAGVRTSWGDRFSHYIECNIQATQCLLEASIGIQSLKRFIYASSSSVYGTQAIMPCIETQYPQPNSPYGVTKLAGEHLCQVYAKNFRLPIVCLRYFSAYGPRQRPDMGFFRFFQALLEGRPLPIFGELSTKRDYTYISDVVAATLSAASSSVPYGEVVNIASGRAFSLIEVMDLLEAITNRSIPFHCLPEAPGDVSMTWANIEKAGTLFGYHPRTLLSDGLREQFQWMRALYQS